jgi:AAA+ ATPase superfamily predicted ATPase
MSMHLIAREEECKTLQSLLDSNRPEFLALYGRRRIGKTYLIREFYKDKDAIFFNVTGTKDAKLKVQIEHFTLQIGEVFLGGIMPKSEKTWDETFKTLNDAIVRASKDKKIILFLDELPWMATKNSGLIRTIEYYWNQYWSNDNRIKLIICGSSASWIINKIIKNKGGLHNRVTRKIRLEPLNLSGTKKFLSAQGAQLNNRQILQVYMLTGGVPYYLNYVEKNMSAAQIIEKLAFSKGSILLEEFDNLFSSLFEDSDIHVALIREIAKSRSGIGKRFLLDKIGKSHMGGGGISKLDELEEAGFIMRLKPHFHKRRGIYYRLSDEYTSFYLHWIEPIRESLQVQSLETGNWQEIQNSPAWNNWLGYAFESVCYKHISQIRKKLSVSPTAIANSWRYVPVKNSQENGAQIDLLMDRRDGAMTIFEIKYSDKPFLITKEYAKNLTNKRDIFIKKTRTQKQIFIVMMTSSGLIENPYSDELINGVVTLDDLFD